MMRAGTRFPSDSFHRRRSRWVCSTVIAPLYFYRGNVQLVFVYERRRIPMAILFRPCTSRINIFLGRNLFKAMIGLAAVTVPVSALAQTPAVPNPDCTLTVPLAPLTALGLATPYQLTATDPAKGPCHELDPNQSAFVQAAILDPATGTISIYNPLVIDEGTAPAVPPVVPLLPMNAVVGIWFGHTGDNLTLRPSVGALADNSCVNGLPGSVFGQYAYCNAPAFFGAAHVAINAGKLTIPPLGTARDNRPCPSSRDFMVVDQDPSDNVTATYLATAQGLVAQNTSLNRAVFAGARVFANPSDERLLDVFIDPALGCAPMMAPDLADGGNMVPALALNELRAGARQLSPVALVPLKDPMALVDGNDSLTKLNAYRIGVDQPQVRTKAEADPVGYCANFRQVAPTKLLLDRVLLTAFRSPFPNVANSLFTFLAQRFVATYEILNCQAFLNQPDPITLFTDQNGVVIDATIN